MTRVKSIGAAAVLAAVTVFSGTAAAQDTNVSERTFMTFSNTFELPGLTLQPGTYVFKLADTPSRNVVQVWSRDEKEILGQWTYVQADRNRVSDETVVMFKEMPAGMTPAVQYWYYPGERIGKEFIYPREQADRIAKATGVKVLSTDTQEAAVAAPPATVAQADTNPTQSQVQLPARPEPAVEQPRTQAAVADQPRPVGTTGVQEAQTARAATLPQTASPLALMGLLGLLSLAGAAGVRAYRK
jgi:hypothetical protein